MVLPQAHQPTQIGRMNYVGLHVHTHYSLFDGVATPEEYINRAVDLGMPALAITDHGTLSGHRELYRGAKAKGIKPILGLEGYMCADISDKRDKSVYECYKQYTDVIDPSDHWDEIKIKRHNGINNSQKKENDRYY